jgi:hypothetical protein
MTTRELAVLRDGFPPSFWRSWRTTLMPALRRAGSLAPALEGRIVAAAEPFAPSSSLMSHSCPQLYLGVQKTLATSLEFEDALLIARAAELGFQIAYDAASNDPTGIAGAAAAIPLGIAMGTRFALEEIRSRAEACESENHEKILHDVVGPGVKAMQESLKALDNLDVKVSTRASQSSLDGHAAAIQSLTNARANQLEALLKARADYIDAELKRREDFADAYLANVVAHQQLDLQVVEIERGRLLLVASEAGTTVNVSLTGVRVAEAKPTAPLTFHDVTATTQARQNTAGVLEITLDMRGPAKDATVYIISVAHGHGSISPIGPVTHTGTTIFRRTGT